MAAEVSSMVRLRGGYQEEQRRVMAPEAGVETSTALITRDLLGGSSNFSESQELDLDLQVPTGWEKKLDLKSGKIYVQKCSPANLTPIYDLRHHSNTFLPNLQDLNSSPSKITLNLFDETCLEFTTDSSLPSSSSNYQSVCTLDKVKSALERVDKDPTKKRALSSKPSNSPSCSSLSSMKELSSSSSVKEFSEEEENEKLFFSPVAAGCPGCLSYVLVTKNNPRCPRCSSVVPFPSTKKRPRIDLNISILNTTNLQ